MSHWKLDPGTITQIFIDLDEAMEPLNSARDWFHELLNVSARLDKGRDTVVSAFKGFMSARTDVHAGLMLVVENRSGEVSQAVMSLVTGSVEMQDVFDEGSTFARDKFGFESLDSYNTLMETPYNLVRGLDIKL